MVQAPGSYHNFTTNNNNAKIMSQAVKLLMPPSAG